VISSRDHGQSSDYNEAGVSKQEDRYGDYRSFPVLLRSTDRDQGRPSAFLVFAGYLKTPHPHPDDDISDSSAGLQPLSLDINVLMER